jgi:hypothetical protein
MDTSATLQAALLRGFDRNCAALTLLKQLPVRV